MNRITKITNLVKHMFSFVNGKNVLIFIPYTWLIIFLLFPCFILLKISFSDSTLASPPYTSITEWIDSIDTLSIRLNLSNYKILFSDEMYIKGFLSSIMIAFISTTICLLIGFPMAYAIARSDEKIRGILLMLVVLPFWTSFLIRVYAWVMLLSPTGIINNTLMNMHIINEPLQLMNNTYAACIGIIYTYLPFMILPLYSVIEKLDFSLVEAAHDLGCPPLKTFFSVIIPLSIPGITAGAALVFIPSIGEFVIPELLGGPQTLTIGRVVWNEFFGNLSWPTAAAVSIVLIVFIVIQCVIGEQLSNVSLTAKKENANEQ